MQVEFFTTKIREFADTFDWRTRENVSELVLLLEEYGSELRMPYSKSLGGGVFELRAISTTHVRLLYCFYHGKAMILHIVNKKQNKLNNRDIALARARKDMLA